MTRENNFDAMRIIAALVVIFGHAHPLSAQPDPTLLGSAVQSVAVKIFFVVSGFLVAKSWWSDPHIGRFSAAARSSFVSGSFRTSRADCPCVRAIVHDAPNRRIPRQRRDHSLFRLQYCPVSGVCVARRVCR
ncbi:hypothetical protein C7E14_07130 [Stenotrophomonas maltophilia]|nr:hypothetical protein C7E14_07130 [Stenotrophomonas maltophilia]